MGDDTEQQKQPVAAAAETKPVDQSQEAAAQIRQLENEQQTKTDADETKRILEELSKTNSTVLESIKKSLGFSEDLNKEIKTLDNSIKELTAAIKEEKDTQNRETNETSAELNKEEKGKYFSEKEKLEDRYKNYENTGFVGSILKSFIGEEKFQNTLKKAKKQELQELKQQYGTEPENKSETEQSAVTPVETIKAENTAKGGAQEIANVLGGPPEPPENDENKIKIVEFDEKAVEQLKKILGPNRIKDLPEENKNEKTGTNTSTTDLINSGIGSNIIDDITDLSIPQKTEKVGEKAGEKTVVKAEEKAVEKVGEKAAEKVVEKAGEKATEKTAEKAIEKTVIKTAEKTAAKTILKRIPLIGLLAGGYFAAQRALEGDYLGAGLELASGAASSLDIVAPGVGVAAGLTIDAALAGRDIYNAYNPDTVPGTDPEKTEVQGTGQTEETAALLKKVQPLGDVEAKAPITAESALKKPAESSFIKLPEKAETDTVITSEPATANMNQPTIVVPTTSSAIANVASSQEIPAKESEEIGKEEIVHLTDTLNGIKELLTDNSNKMSTVMSNNVSNSGKTSTVVNMYSYSGEEINSSRNKTDMLFTRYRQLA